MKAKLMFHKIAALMLTSAVMMTVSAISGISASAAGTEVNSPEALQSAVDAAGTDAATLTLTADITANSSIVIGKDQDITIDLGGFTLGRALDLPTAKGSVIIVEGGTLTVKDSSPEHTGCITGGYAADLGGGISCVKKEKTPSSLTLSGVAFKNNRAESGGAVYADSGCTVTISSCAFEGNGAKMGGAVTAMGDVTLDGCTIKNNIAELCGGGIYVNTKGKTTIKGKTAFSGNASGTDGGAVYVDDAPADHKAILFDNCVFRGNRADRDGGALFVCDDGVALSNTEITKNSAKKRGGAVFVDARYGITVRGLVIIKNNTCDDNKSMANLTLEDGAVDEAKIMDAGLYKGSHIAIGTTATSGKTYLSYSNFSKYQTRYFSADEGKLDFSKYIGRYSLMTTSASIFGNGNVDLIICFGLSALVLTVIIIVAKKKRMRAAAVMASASLNENQQGESDLPSENEVSKIEHSHTGEGGEKDDQNLKQDTEKVNKIYSDHSVNASCYMLSDPGTYLYHRKSICGR